LPIFRAGTVSECSKGFDKSGKCGVEISLGKHFIKEDLANRDCSRKWNCDVMFELGKARKARGIGRGTQNLPMRVWYRNLGLQTFYCSGGIDQASAERFVFRLFISSLQSDFSFGKKEVNSEFPFRTSFQEADHWQFLDTKTVSKFFCKMRNETFSVRNLCLRDIRVGLKANINAEKEP
jgi:hypothetical protein